MLSVTSCGKDASAAPDPLVCMLRGEFWIFDTRRFLRLMPCKGLRGALFLVVGFFGTALVGGFGTV